MADVEKTRLSDEAVEKVAGGGDKWQEYSKGKYYYNGNAINYTIASGDALSGIAIRFGVTVQDICDWNGIKNPDVIAAGQNLVIYPRR